jgi:hypothetical protein
MRAAHVDTPRAQVYPTQKLLIMVNAENCIATIAEEGLSQLDNHALDGTESCEMSRLTLLL